MKDKPFGMNSVFDSRKKEWQFSSAQYPNRLQALPSLLKVHELTAHIHLVTKLIHGAAPPHSHHTACLILKAHKHRNKFSLHSSPTISWPHEAARTSCMDILMCFRTWRGSAGTQQLLHSVAQILRAINLKQHSCILAIPACAYWPPSDVVPKFRLTLLPHSSGQVRPVEEAECYTVCLKTNVSK